MCLCEELCVYAENAGMGDKAFTIADWAARRAWARHEELQRGRRRKRRKDKELREVQQAKEHIAEVASNIDHRVKVAAGKEFI